MQKTKMVSPFSITNWLQINCFTNYSINYHKNRLGLHLNCVRNVEPNSLSPCENIIGMMKKQTIFSKDHKRKIKLFHSFLLFSCFRIVVIVDEFYAANVQTTIFPF